MHKEQLAKMLELRAQGKTIRQISQETGNSINKVWRNLKKANNPQPLPNTTKTTEENAEKNYNSTQSEKPTQ